MPTFEAQQFLDDINEYGEPYRLWNLMPYGAESPTGGTTATATGGEKSGRVPVERDIPDDSLCLVVGIASQLDMEPFGLVPTGEELRVRLNLNVEWVAHGDRVMLPNRIHEARYDLNRTSGTADDTLTHGFIESIREVRQGNTIYADDVYSLVANSSTTLPFAGDKLRWLGSTKPADNSAYGVAYKYRRVWEFLMNNGQMPQLGSDDLYMPITGVLKPYLPGS